MPGQSNHQTGVTPKIRRPIGVRSRHQFDQVILDGGKATFRNATVAPALTLLCQTAHGSLLVSLTDMFKHFFMLLILEVGARFAFLAGIEARVGTRGTGPRKQQQQ